MEDDEEKPAVGPNELPGGKLEDNELPGDRFSIELEFVELLSNPAYLEHLAVNRYFEDNTFLNYLSYLQYWSKPQYAQHVTSVHALYFLELLQREEFRKKLLLPSFVASLSHSQYGHWRWYGFNRRKEREKLEAETMDFKSIT